MTPKLAALAIALVALAAAAMAVPVPCEPTTTVVDAEAPGAGNSVAFVGKWRTRSCRKMAYNVCGTVEVQGNSFLDDLSQEKIRKSVTFSATLASGSYTVHVAYAANDGVTRKDNVPITITGNGVTASFILNQKVPASDNGYEQMGGVYAFDGLTSVKLENSLGDGKVFADAVKFVRVCA